MPYPDTLLPVGPGYTMIEAAVIEAAHAGCNTIWIVCNDDVTPLIRYQVGEMIQDPVYNYRHFEHNKKEFKRPIRIYYVPINIRDINKRDNLAWSAIHGAKIANKILRKISLHLAPDKFWISWPYGYYNPGALRPHRKIIAEKKCLLFEPVMLKHFVNSLVSVASSFNINFKDEKIMNTQTVNGQDIKTK